MVAAKLAMIQTRRRFLRVPRHWQLHLLGAGIGLLIWAVIGLVAFDDLVPPVMLSPGRLVVATVHPGGQLEIHYRVTVYRSCPSSIAMRVYDGKGLGQPVVPLNLDVTAKGTQKVILRAPVPLDAAAGYGSFWMVVNSTCEMLGGLYVTEHQVQSQHLIYAIQP